MFNWLFGRNKLENVLNQTKKVKIQGIVFTIKAIDMLDYLTGSQVLLQSFDTHKTQGAKAALAPESEKKVRRHYADVLVSGVIEPALTHKKEGLEDKRILVDDMFSNWELVERLYTEIITLTYGKKKVQHAISVAKGLSK